MGNAASGLSRPGSVLTVKPASSRPVSANSGVGKLKHQESIHVPKDVMISYSHQDKEMCQKLREGLERHGITVWVDVTGLKAGVDFLSKIGAAIIDAKAFISLLSTHTIASKYCQDELALAYVSNKPIFPIGLQPAEELFPKMDTGMKLQLARFDWNSLMEEDDFEEELEKLATEIKSVMEQLSSKEKGDPEKDTDSKEKPKLQRQNTRTALRQPQKKTAKILKKAAFPDKLEEATADIDDDQIKDFWKANFGFTVSIPWTQFVEVFTKVYGKAISLVFSENDREWIQSLLHRELEVGEDDMVHKDRYIDFCTIDDEMLEFWPRVQDQAVESYSMREVFNMDSSVRIEAIENLGKFHSKAVVEALIDLLSDKDNNVRAVAAISLAKTGVQNKRVVKGLLKCLNDKDRLVRESGCLALGRLKAEEAVPRLVALWRNDTISSVREAAHLGLEQVGGQEAEKAIHMTKVLAEEIRMLTKE